MQGRADALATPMLPFTGSTDSTRMASRLAAERAGTRAETDRGRVYRCIQVMPCTDNEIAALLKMNPSTVRPRRIELRDAGLVEDAGMKRNGSTIWRAL